MAPTYVGVSLPIIYASSPWTSLTGYEVLTGDSIDNDDPHSKEAACASSYDEGVSPVYLYESSAYYSDAFGVVSGDGFDNGSAGPENAANLSSDMAGVSTNKYFIIDS